MIFPTVLPPVHLPFFSPVFSPIELSILTTIFPSIDLSIFCAIGAAIFLTDVIDLSHQVLFPMRSSPISPIVTTVGGPVTAIP